MSKGLASVKTLSAKEIAAKWKLPLATVAKKIAAGVKVEKEHTTSTRQANEIARDHLGERPDYYDKLNKMEKTKVVKEESTTGGIAGLGINTGTPAIDSDNGYVDTNSMSYDDINGAILKMIKDKHDKHLIDMGFTSFSPNDIQNNSNKIVKEQKLNELGDYVKDGMPGYEGTSTPIRAIRKRDVKEQSPANVSYKERPMYEKSTGKMPADMSGAAERGIYQEGYVQIGHEFDWGGDRVRRRKVYGTKPKEKPESNEPGTGDTYNNSKQGGRVKFAKKPAKPVEESQIDEISDELVGKLSNARFWQGKTPSKVLASRIRKAQLKQPKKNKETKMDTKERINEALDNILEDNLSEMKDNLMLALQEKAMEKLEERKKEIAASYFAQ